MSAPRIPFGVGVVLDGKSKRKGRTPESKQQKALIEYLKLLPWVAKINRHNVGQAWMGANPKTGFKGRPVYFCERGHSDLSVEVKGSPLVVWIETKAPGARPSGKKQVDHWHEQEAFLIRKRSSGHPAFFCAAGEILRTELRRAGLAAPAVVDLAAEMRAKGDHPSTVAAFLRRMREAYFEVPIPARRTA
jgi:hypothetical protein